MKKAEDTPTELELTLFLVKKSKLNRESSYHEAGHIVASFVLSYAWVGEGLWLQPDERTCMITEPPKRRRPLPIPYKAPERSLLCLINVATVSYAGPAAESRYLGKKTIGKPPSSRIDVQQASNFLYVADLRTFPAQVDTPQLIAMAEWIRLRAWNLVAFYWPEIRAVAQLIYERAQQFEDYLPMREIKAVFESALRKRAKTTARRKS